MKETIKVKILEVVEEVDGKKKLSCAQALKIASDLDIPAKEVGDCCNENEIKLQNCMLGCF